MLGPDDRMLMAAVPNNVTLISEGATSLSAGNEEFGVRSMNGSEFSTPNEPIRIDLGGKIGGSRFVDLMQGLQKLVRLRFSATNSSVFARQKKREASIKRQNVWSSDAKFMEEIQRLAALGKLEEFDELQRLAKECQITRDGLGPIEQEAIETEQEWEGKIWILRQAEDDFQFEFQYEFEVADSYPALPDSVASSHSESGPSSKRSNEDGAETLPLFPSTLQPSQREENTLSNSEANLTFSQLRDSRDNIVGKDGLEEQFFAAISPITYSDSGLGDIDEKIPLSPAFGGFIRTPPEIQRTHPSSNEFYPHLLADFVSKRDRINKWLENTVLQSHFEGMSLFNILTRKLDLENLSVPSNWAELVMAYWEHDEAATPYNEQPKEQPAVETTVAHEPSNHSAVHLEDDSQTPIPFLQISTQSSFNESHNSENTLVPLYLQTSTSDDNSRSYHRPDSFLKTELISRRSSNTDRGCISDATANTTISSDWIPVRPAPLSHSSPLRRSKSTTNLQANSNYTGLEWSTFRIS